MLTHARARAQGLVLATGTPMKNGRPANLFPLLAATGHPLGRGKRAFDVRYCEGHFNAWGGWVADGATNLGELHERIRPVMLRMTKADCLDLPPKVCVRVAQTAHCPPHTAAGRIACSARRCSRRRGGGRTRPRWAPSGSSSVRAA